MDIILYSIFSYCEAPSNVIYEFGLIINKLSYSYCAAFIFYFLTQMIKYANDRVMYNDYLLNNIDNCIEIFTDLISQLNYSFSMPISENNIRELQIKKDELIKLLEKIYIIDNDELAKNNLYVIPLVSKTN